jgi:hypothetical protein
VTPARLLRRLVRRIVREDGGWALATTLAVTALMTSVGLASAAYVDGQIRSSTRERIHESDFNLAEGVFNAQVYILSHAWPGALPGTGNTAPNYPASCTPASTSPLCPDATSLGGSYSTADYGSTTTWTTEIHDNDVGQSADFYDDTNPSSARWDSNGDHKVWIRAQATVKGRTRVILGLVQVEEHKEDLPSAALVAGQVSTTNNGNKEIICTRLPDNPDGHDCTSGSGLAGPVMVRCTGGVGSPCQDYRDGQISPDSVITGYTGTGLSPDALDRLRQRAMVEGTYYATGCPSTPAGHMVFIENADCSWNNSTQGTWNSPDDPGMLIINRGTVSLNGNQTFYGVIYAQNAQGAVGCDPACPVQLNGTVAVQGGVQVAGQGGVDAGSSKVNIMFDPAAFDAVQSFGAATLVQNKWREIVPRPGT